MRERERELSMLRALSLSIARFLFHCQEHGSKIFSLKYCLIVFNYSPLTTSLSGSRVESDVANHYEERNRNSLGVQSAATTATTPESMVNKTFSDDEEPYQRRYKKPPIGGIAVLPLIDSKRTEDQRKSPVDRVESRSPPYGATYDPSSTYRTSYTEEVSVNLT